jgi:hypothetical protein
MCRARGTIRATSTAAKQIPLTSGSPLLVFVVMALSFYATVPGLVQRGEKWSGIPSKTTCGIADEIPFAKPI